MKSLVNRVANGVSAIGNSGLALYGEKLQGMVAEGIINYQNYMGYLSDFTASAAFSSLFLGVANFNKDIREIKYLFPLGMGVVWSLGEFVDKTGTFDLKDIGAYFAGAGLATALDYVSEKIDKKKSKIL